MVVGKHRKCIAVLVTAAMVLTLFVGNPSVFAAEIQQDADTKDEISTEQKVLDSEKSNTEGEIVVEKEEADKVVEDVEVEPSEQTEKEKEQEKQVVSTSKSEDGKEPVEKVTKSAPLKAPARAEVQDNVITNIDALLQDGSGPVGATIGQWQTFRISADFALPDGKVREGDTTTVKLPEKLRFDQTVPFQVKDSAGNVVANAVVNGPGKTLTLTYTDYPEKHSGVTGNFFFYVRMDRSVVDGETDIPLDFVINNEVISAGSVHFNGYPTPAGTILGKSGTQESGVSGSQAWFNVNVNIKGEDLKDVSVVDTLKSKGITINKNRFRIKKGTWKLVKGDWQLDQQTDVTSQFTVDWNSDDSGFTLPLGDVGPTEGYQITYYVDSDYTLIDGETIDNNVVLHAKDMSETSFDARITWVVAGGSAEGYVYKIKIKKVDGDDTTSALAGAVFQVKRVANNAIVGTITTNASGEGELGSLLKDEYELIEITAPEGYELNSDPITVKADDFNSETKIASKTIENRQATIDIPVEKTWVGPKAGPVTVHLFANKEDTGKSLVLSEDNNWSGTFSGLMKKDAGGSDIIYTVEEDPVTGYQDSYSGDVESGFIVTNKNIETIDLNGEKTWDDNDDQDGIRPDKITVRLAANGTETQHKEVTKEDNWKWVFSDLPKYDDQGNEITYTVSEDPVAGYSTEPKGEAGFVNRHTPGKTSVKVTKAWEDANNQDGLRPEQVIVRLLADREDTGKTLQLDESNQWTGSFTDLDEFKAGKKIEYTIEEVNVTGYTSQITGDSKAGYVVTNKHVPEQTEVSGSKTWDDNDNQDGVRPEQITIRLLADGKEIDQKTVTESDQWAWSFENLPKFENGNEITYTVTEDSVSDYSTEPSGKASFVNRHAPRKTSVMVTKVWEDANNQDGLRPEQVTVRLLADGTDTGKTLQLDENNQWIGSFTDLDEFKAGKKIEYTIEEVNVKGYTSEITGDNEVGYVVTNKHVPEQTEVSGRKTWVDKNNQDGIRPAQIGIRLLANGKDVERTP